MSNPSHISQSSAEDDESSTHGKTLTKSQHKVAPEAPPQASTDPVFYREVDMSDLPSQYTEEVETFRQILDSLTPGKLCLGPLLLCSAWTTRKVNRS